MNSRMVAIALCFCCFLPPLASAGDSAGNYAIWGVGRASCHQFLKASNEPKDTRFKVFLMGYLTAFNTLQEDTYNATGDRNLDTTLEALGDYCRNHQMDSFDRAIQQLLAGSFETRHRVPPGRERGWGRAPVPSAPEEGETGGPRLTPP